MASFTAEAVSTLPVQPARHHQERQSAHHVPALDGLRGIAILLVLGHHFRFVLDPAFRMERISLFLLDGGWCGVQLFFVLSGFLITGILLDTKRLPNFFRNFYARRALRIFPLYYCYLAFVFVGLVFWWNTHFHYNPWRTVNPAWYLLYLENFKPHHMFYDQFLAHLWSLCVEEQFYLVWPLIVLLVSRASLGLICFVGIAAALISRLFLAGHGVEQSFFLNTLTLASVDSLCAGALVALLIRKPHLAKRVRPWMRALTVLSALFFATMVKASHSLFLYSVPIDTWGLTSLNIFFACVIYWSITATPRSLWQWAFSLSPLRAIGRVSYGMYILHPVVIGFVVPQIAPVPPGTRSSIQLVIKLSVLLLLTVTTYLVSLLSWTVLESPVLSLKRYFRYVDRGERL